MPGPGGGQTTSETRLTLDGPLPGGGKFGSGKLVCEKGNAFGMGKPEIAGATITFTGSGVPTNEVAETDSDGNYLFWPPDGLKLDTYNVQAHFSGPSNQGFQVIYAGSDSDVVTFHVK